MNVSRETRREDRQLNSGSSISIGLAILVIAVSVQLNMKITALDASQQVEAVKSRAAIEALSQQMSRELSDRWTRSNMRAWAEVLKASNESVKVPEVPTIHEGQ